MLTSWLPNSQGFSDLITLATLVVKQATITSEGVVMAFAETRLTESGRLLKDAFLFALATYTEQESTKADYWRDVDLGALYAHLHHEVDLELKGNIKRQELDFLLHNAADAASLAIMLLARVMERCQITTDIGGKPPCV